MADPYGYGAVYGEAEYGDAEYGELSAAPIPPPPTFTRDASVSISALDPFAVARLVNVSISATNPIAALLIIFNVLNALSVPLPVIFNVLNGGLNASLPITFNVVDTPNTLPIYFNVIPNLIPLFDASIQQPTAEVEEIP